MSEIGAEIKREHFTKNRQEYQINGRSIEVMSISPEEVKKNSHTGEAVNPIFFEYGYGGEAMAEWFAQTMAREGRPTYLVRYLAGEPHDPQLISLPEEAQASQLDIEKAKDRVALLERMGIAHTDLIAESAGAARAILEVNERPDLFENIVLVHPAGLDNQGYVATHLHVVEHQAAAMLHPVMISERLKRWWRRKQITKSLNSDEQESQGWDRKAQKAVARARLHNLIPAMKEQHPHLSFSIVADKYDFNFRPRRLEKINGTSLFEFVRSNWGNHGVGHHPERVKQIDHLLTRMEERKGKENN